VADEVADTLDQLKVVQQVARAAAQDIAELVVQAQQDKVTTDPHLAIDQSTALAAEQAAHRSQVLAQKQLFLVAATMAALEFFQQFYHQDIILLAAVVDLLLLLTEMDSFGLAVTAA
jgi:3-methyladenine DNA glycosylase/8-oxoguanine DNA glycosylase